MTTWVWERSTTFMVVLLAVVATTALAATTGLGATPAMHLAAAAPAVTSPSGAITVVHTPSGATGPCVPALLGLRRSVRSDADGFRLRIEVTAPLCSRINAVAVIYRMPGRGVAWPQTLQDSLGFTLREPGITEVTFAKHCDPVQFDVVTGATPATISPTGPWHGPLLFPLDISTTLQHWGCGPDPTTTTSSSTTTSTTTTVVDDCDDYTPGGLAVTPSSAAPGQEIRVSGTARPGTVLQVVLRSSTSGVRTADDGDTSSDRTDAGPHVVAALSDPVLVGADGTWATTLVVPPDAEPGTWTVAARAEQCDTEVTVGLDVVDGDPSSGPPTTDGPLVAGVTEVAELPDDAVALGARADAAPRTAGSAGGLAFTGSATHLPVAAGILLLAAGGLLLLRSHRRQL